MMRRARAVFVVGAFALVGCGSTTTPTTAPGSTTAPTATSTATTAPSGAGSATGNCTFLDSATVQQDVGITVSTVTQVQGGCLFESAGGSHDAPNDVKYLHGHDGMILGITTGSLQTSPTCQQSSIPGVPAPGAVCQQAAGVTLAAFQLSGGRVGSLTIYAASTPPLSQVDQLAAAAYPKMLAG